MAKLLEVQVLTPAGAVFEGRARSLVAPAWDGRVGVLPRHAPFLTLLGTGPLEVRTESGDPREFSVSGGVMKVEADAVIVLADRADADGAATDGADGSPR